MNNYRKNSAIQAKSIPVGRGSWYEDEDDEDDVDDSLPYATSGLSSKTKVWLVIGIIVYIYFRFINI